jgi:hypothetical protein
VLLPNGPALLDDALAVDDGAVLLAGRIVGTAVSVVVVLVDGVGPVGCGPVVLGGHAIDASGAAASAKAENERESDMRPLRRFGPIRDR